MSFIRRHVGDLRGREGFTLTELLAVMAILGILAGLVAGAMVGLGTSSQESRLVSDRVTIDKAIARFFNDSFPQSYPVIDFASVDSSLKLAGDLGVRIVDFDARLPQDPTKTFVPDFLKEIPESAALVSWRVDTKTSKTFFADDAAPLIPPAEPRVGVSAATTTKNIASNYTVSLKQNKSQAAIEVLTLDLPAGYTIGGQSLSADKVLGTLAGTFSGDNPWEIGQLITFGGTLKPTGLANEWTLEITYDTNTTSSGKTDVDVKETGTSTRSHKVTIVPPVSTSPGQIRIEMARSSDPDQNEATETWTLTINGTVDSQTVILNPASGGVFRWLANVVTSIDVEGIFISISGNQAVVIK